MNYFKKGLLAGIVMMSCLSASATFWVELEKHNPHRIEAIHSLRMTLEAAQDKDASPELKRFANTLIRNMAPYAPNSLEWEEVLNYFDMAIQECRRHPMDFCELLKDRDACIRLFKSRVSCLRNMQNIPGEELIPFLNNPLKSNK